MPDMKPRSLDTIKKYISDHDLQHGIVVSGGDVGAFAEQYISIHNDGFDIFTLYDKEVKIAEPYSWSDFNRAEIDRLALSARIKLNGAKSVYIRVPEIKEVLLHLESHEIKTEYIQRKWYRKILGFRSGKRWKMITAGIGYLLIILLIMGFFIPN
ncbi:hypothetical protein OYT88_00215 [Sporolactobacillus sp. CQH2019]|uniref:hypothetical protein n=1 Tax=Sporolactobacillus sp. CQH2019 TaxID=3023512 RepID=UPI002368A8B3|nr:hypothetical protein [Sporolactobacillus sp. CQH2019]MDD9146968.1 hypothetical protein [Sporolactobacillus sp. CQH2019]